MLTANRLFAQRSTALFRGWIIATSGDCTLATGSSNKASIASYWQFTSQSRSTLDSVWQFYKACSWSGAW